MKQAKIAADFVDSLSDDQLAKMCVPSRHCDNVTGVGFQANRDLLPSQRNRYDALARTTYLRGTVDESPVSKDGKTMRSPSALPVQAYLELAASFSVGDRKGGSGWVPVFDYGSGSAEQVPALPSGKTATSTDFSKASCWTPATDQRRFESLLNRTAARLKRHELPADFLFPESAFARGVEIRFNKLNAAQRAMIRAAASRHTNMSGIDWEHAVVVLRHTLSFNGNYSGGQPFGDVSGAATYIFEEQIL